MLFRVDVLVPIVLSFTLFTPLIISLPRALSIHMLFFILLLFFYLFLRDICAL